MAMQVIDTQVKRNNVAVDHNLYQSRLAVSWANRHELKVLDVDVNGGIPVITIEEPAPELNLHKKAWMMTDDDGVTFCYPLIIRKHKIANIKWHSAPVSKQGVH